MATARRAYTAEYQYGFTPEVQPERVRRTRQRPEVNGQQEQRQETILTPGRSSHTHNRCSPDRRNVYMHGGGQRPGGQVSVFHQPAEKPEHFAGKRDRKP